VASKNRDRQSREVRERLKAYTARQQVHDHARARRTRDNVIAVLGVTAVVALTAATQVFYFSAGPGAPTPEPSASAVVGENVGVPSADYAEYRTWTGELTLNDVALGIELDGAAAPQAVSAFLSDVDTGYYVDKTCHRLATSEGFELLQCGSIDGLGSSDPAFSYGPIENAPADDFYPAGTIAMARVSGDDYSNGHQFFLVYGDSTIPSDEVGGYTVLGTITSGLDDLIDQITSAGIDPDLLGTDGTGGPLVTTTITQITLQ
tara:strand:- start:9074 stop:9859 length:786 start_codon:yes stop_codon:yes gene_type:complete